MNNILIFWTLFMVTMVVSSYWWPTSASTTTTPTTYTPTQDTYVDSSVPSGSFGGETNLKVDCCPDHQYALLEFDLTLTGTPTSVVLYLYVNNPSNEAGTLELIEAPWGEGTTWDTAPRTGAVIDLPEPVERDTTISTDITSMVTVSGTYGFKITPGTDTDGVFYASREDANPPRIEVNYEDGTSTVSTHTWVGAGDMAHCPSNGDEITADLITGIRASSPHPVTVYTAGDNVYEEGTDQEFQECYEPSWGVHKDITLPSVGNHEYLTAGASGYFNYFGTAAGDPDKGYYSYDLGEWHIVVLNSNCSKVGGCTSGSPQYTWLENDLQTTSTSCTAAVWHHPRYSSGQHGNQNHVDPLWRLVAQYGADVVVAGHDHNYERLAPMDADGNFDPDGVQSFVAGMGGKNKRDPGPDPHPNSVTSEYDTWGVLEFTLFDGGYDYQFVGEPGSTYQDSGSGVC